VPAAAAARSENQGFMRALRHLGFGPTWVRDVQRLLIEVRDAVKWIEARTRAERHVVRHRARPPRPVDAIPLPDPPSSPEVVERGADTSGRQAPGVPL